MPDDLHIPAMQKCLQKFKAGYACHESRQEWSMLGLPTCAFCVRVELCRVRGTQTRDYAVIGEQAVDRAENCAFFQRPL